MANGSKILLSGNAICARTQNFLTNTSNLLSLAVFVELQLKTSSVTGLNCNPIRP